jgi:hypothetical protein
MSDTVLPPDCRLLDNIHRGTHTILYGPPGTGKSHLITTLGRQISIDSRGYKTIEIEVEGVLEQWVTSTVQFTPSTEETDLLVGVGLNRDKELDIQIGWLCEFSDFLDNSDLDKGIFIIDEMSRADLTLAFGQLFYALEHGSVRLKYMEEAFTLSDKIVIVGTMNTADKNVRQLDIAFRRRFSWIPVMPDYDLIQSWAELFNDDLSVLDENYEFGFRYRRFAEELNRSISEDRLAGPQLQLGQALFFPTRAMFDEGVPNNFTILFEHIRSVLLPQLLHYSNNNVNVLHSWTTQAVSSKLVQFEYITGNEIFGFIDVVSNPVLD